MDTQTRRKPVGKQPAIPPESETVEWKESLGEWKEIAETVAAFATHRGGRIFVGVDRKGEVRGVQHGGKSMEDITNRIVQNTDPRIVPSVRMETHQKKDILVIDVEEARSKPIHAFGRPFKRSGRTNQRLSPDQSAAIYMASRGQTWDETVFDDARMADISMKNVRSFIATARRERKVEWSGRDAPIKVLRLLKLVSSGKPTVAAILLFGSYPQHHLIQSEIRCARFKYDSSERPIDLKVIAGTVVNQADEVLRFVQRNIRMAVEVRDGGPRRTDVWQYPLDAVREAVVNAICHRDYASTSNVQVRIFDESLEVWSPGLLPHGITIRDLKRNHESKPRNKLIATTFFLAGVIEKFGQGTQNIISLCREAGIPAPEFEETGSSFIVRFRRSEKMKTEAVHPQATEQVTVQVTVQVRRLLGVLQSDVLSSAEIMKSLKLSHRPTFLYSYLQPALKAGLVVMTIPDKPNSRLQKYRSTPAGIKVLKQARQHTARGKG